MKSEWIRMDSNIIKKKKKLIESKPLVVGGLIGIFAVAGIIGGMVFLISQEDEETDILIIGLPIDPVDWSWVLDPLKAPYPDDSYLIDQVAEGLFTIDTNTTNSEIVHNLAFAHNWSSDASNLTCFLKENVRFHDGTPFNAEAVKWNFDRIYRLRLNLEYPNLWKFPNGTYIINRTLVIDEFTVKFVLNGPYVPLINLLASPFSYILSPTSTPPDRFINEKTEDLVATGPFIQKHENYEYGHNISLSANSHYWSRKPFIDELVFMKINSLNGMTALKSGKIHLIYDGPFNKTTLDMFRTNASFIVREYKFSNLHWMIMNNNIINVTMRKAFSYALNYSAITEMPYLTRGAKFIKANSPIPETILYHNISGINVPYYNISQARQILIDAGLPSTSGLTANDNISTGNEWETLANSASPLATYNYSYIYDRGFTVNFSSILVKNFEQIGVKIIPVGISMAEYLLIIEEKPGYHRDMLEFTICWWAADFNDPCNYINDVYTNKVVGRNVAQVNDTLIQQWMELAMRETEPILRKQLYYQIQKRLIEDIYPHLWMHSLIKTSIHQSNLEGWYPNSFKLDLKSVKFI
jgi:peptide/nickel transport system substrate-binding protein